MIYILPVMRECGVPATTYIMNFVLEDKIFKVLFQFSSTLDLLGNYHVPSAIIF